MIEFGHTLYVSLVDAESSKQRDFIGASYIQIVCLFKVNNFIENLAKCKACAVKQFLHAKSINCSGDLWRKCYE